MGKEKEFKRENSESRRNLAGHDEPCVTPDTPAPANGNTEHSQRRPSNDVPSEIEPSVDNSNIIASVKSTTTPKAKPLGHHKLKAQPRIQYKKQPQTTDTSDDSTCSDSSSDLDLSDNDFEKEKTHRSSSTKKGKTTVRAKTKSVKPKIANENTDAESTTDEVIKRKKQKAKKAKKLREKAKAAAKLKRGKQTDSSDSDDESPEVEAQLVKSKNIDSTFILQEATTNILSATNVLTQLSALRLGEMAAEETGSGKTEKQEKADEPKKTVQTGSKSEYIRLDQLWSNQDHCFFFSPSTVVAKAGQYEEYAFKIVRNFNYENQYLHTKLMILSKPLRMAMLEVMGKVKGITLEEAKPKVDPNVVFLHLEELRAYMNKLKTKCKLEKSRKKAKESALTVDHLKVLLKYLDKDYDDVKKSLYPLLEAGRITFDLVWALFKSNEIVCTHTYKTKEQPRALKIEYVTKDNSKLKGDYYRVEGCFLDSDGEDFGMAGTQIDVMNFKGPRAISSLACYPFKYHKDHEKLRIELIERGKKFVALAGMQYKFQKGIAFHKKDDQVIKVHVNGRAMLDPATFRRLRPNYAFSEPKKDYDIVSDYEESDKDIDKATTSSSDEASQDDPLKWQSEKQQRKKARKARRNRKKKAVTDSSDSDEIDFVPVAVDECANKEKPLEILTSKEEAKHVLTDEEYLIASPVVLGFSFSDKLWLEFAVSGLGDIQWNEGAFDSLIIPEDQKLVVKALVESHAYEAKRNIDDVIQGKGRGLVGVLHGPPGTGKTLTAEGIAELLKKPLYAVSVGELGIRGGDVERNLTEILDVAHTWGALLLLDEADVFLQARTNDDISRNALVSIFLRTLEYFQGILFLTTNRVTTFDPAFASRIHIGLRYSDLTIKAKKSVWKMFIAKVKALPDVEVDEISEEEFTRLANFELNGREIKNAVRTAQSIALTEKRALSIKHLLQVLLVGSVFAKDLKGAGYEEALKFYM